jgi:flagellar hook-associated protein 3 FlgL
MTLRTPNPYRSYQTQINLQRSKERYGILQEQLTTGSRITRLSDDPTAAALIMDFETSIKRNDMYVKQGETASSFLKGTESALNTVVIQIHRLLELAEQGLSELTSPRGREAISAEVDGLRTIILDVANTKEQGKYIFAGTNTKTMPFLLDQAAYSFDPANDYLPTDDVTTYLGNANLIDLDISPTASITSNLTGQWVFQGESGNPHEDIFVAVSQLRDGLINNDTELILKGYNNIRAIHDRINVCLTTVGARHTQIESLGFNLGDLNESLQSIQNVYEAVDYPLAASLFLAEQNSQQATYSVLSSLNKHSLFDYIG